MKRYIVVALAMVAIAGLVSPAVGAPSIGQVASIARQALSIGKQANRKANQARNAANRAGTKASNALLLAQSKPDLGQITEVRATASIPPGGIQIAVARCPVGMRVLSGGAFTEAWYSLWVSEPDETSTAWIAGGDNFENPGSAAVEATAFCGVPGRAVSARLPSGAARRQAIQAEVASLLDDRREALASR